MRVCLIRPTADFGGDIRFSGGRHGFRALAETLSAAGHDVHVLYRASKSQLLYEAMMKGCMPQLGYSQAVEGIAVFKERGVTHHLGLTDVEQSAHDHLTEALASLGTSTTSADSGLTLPLQRLTSELQHLMHSSSNAHQHQQSWVILDADGSQEPLSPGACTLLEACTRQLDPRRVLLLVQNIHFLPLGPAGTAARTPGLLAAWSKLGGVICCSQFVKDYIWQHAGPLGFQQHQITVAHYATWHAFGRGPFQDLGPAAAQKVPYSITTSSVDSTEQQQQQQQQQQQPIIGCMKLTQEKGGHLFLSLAQQLPQLNFLAVCSDPVIQQQAAALSLTNLRLIQPEADVSNILKHLTVVLAPSIWQEAYGMVVTDAVLRGIPVIVSDQGGLAEAALGVAAAVVPVNPMALPTDSSVGHPSWKHRQFPTEQPVQQWGQALQHVLSSKEAYMACSQACRAAGEKLLRQQPELLQRFEYWLHQLNTQPQSLLQ